MPEESSVSLTLLLTQLAYRAPGMLAYLTGVVLSLVYLRRHPRPAVLALLGSGLLLLVSTASLFLAVFLLRPDGNLQQRALLFGIIGFAASILHAIGFILVAVAVFIGRRGRMLTGVLTEAPVAPEAVSPVPGSGEETRFKV
jgi:hypothetical protein